MAAFRTYPEPNLDPLGYLEVIHCTSPLLRGLPSPGSLLLSLSLSEDWVSHSSVDVDVRGKFRLLPPHVRQKRQHSCVQKVMWYCTAKNGIYSSRCRP